MSLQFEMTMRVEDYWYKSNIPILYMKIIS
jgi:hypothetical protein